jgi:transcriptional regulator with XRE-family HTH domain
MAVLAGRLQKVKARRGWQAKVAVRAGVSAETVTRWKAGDGNPKLSELEALADALGVSVCYLISADAAEETPRPLTFDEELAGMTIEQKLALLQRLAAGIQSGRG